MNKYFYERNLPHYQPPVGTFFVTTRLDGSLPKEAIERLQAERLESERYFSGIDDRKKRSEKFDEIRESYFAKFEELLDWATTGPKWLSEPAIAEIVKEALHFRDGKKYDLFAYTIMSNHIHLIVSFERFTSSRERLGESHYKSTKSVGGANTGYVVSDIMGSLKKHTALEANKILKRTGAFWQHESYDHVIRNGEELERMILYVLYNPVKAGLVDSWEKWRWAYCKPGLL